MGIVTLKDYLAGMVDGTARDSGDAEDLTVELMKARGTLPDDAFRAGCKIAGFLRKVERQGRSGWEENFEIDIPTDVSADRVSGWIDAYYASQGLRRTGSFLESPLYGNSTESIWVNFTPPPRDGGLLLVTVYDRRK